MQTTTSIGRKCKRSDAFSRAVLIRRAAWLFLHPRSVITISRRNSIESPAKRHSFAGGHRGVVIPVPIPNTEVKRSFAEGSVGPAHARVGRRRLFFCLRKKSPGVVLRPQPSSDRSAARAPRSGHTPALFLLAPALFLLAPYALFAWAYMSHAEAQRVQRRRGFY